MDGFGPTSFGELNADGYDEDNDPGTTQEAVNFIANLAGPNAKILELAIGSGRLSLPLVEMGFDISGIEASQAMVDLMRAKPLGADVPVVIGDMADVDIEGPFDHVFLAFNTLFNLTSQEAQVRCFQNVGKKLKKGGTFLVETYVPKIVAFVNDQQVSTKKLELDKVWIEAATHDPLAQRFDMQRIRITNEGFKLVPLVMRYAHLPELDLMAQLGGMKLVERWGSWEKAPFDKDSKMHVSVYQRVA